MELTFAPDAVPAPVVALVALALLAALLRWTWRRGTSLVGRPGTPGAPRDYGLLVPVSRPGDRARATAECRVLARAGIRATVADSTEGPCVLVFPDDAERAATELTAG